MKKRIVTVISALLALLMIGSAFASCTNGNVTNDPSDSDPESNTGESESSEIENDDDPEDSGEDAPTLNFDNASSIEYASSILNGVNYYYTSASRESAILENKEMDLEYGLLTKGNKKVTYLKNKNGVSYVENTMDIFVRMNDGNTYFASTTNAVTTSNLFRLGYYFYEARYEGQDFLNSVKITDTKSLDLSKGSSKNNSTESKLNENGELEVVITSTNDPYIVLADGSHRGDYHFLEITLKADPEIHYGQVYIITGSSNGFNNDQKYGFSIVADGEYHTYSIPLNLINGYDGKIRGIRFDLDGALTNMNGASYTFKDIKFLTAENFESLPAGLSIARSFTAYSDKLHHTLQVSASTETVNIAEIGMLTEIKEDTVAKLIIKDKCEELHTSLDGVDWSTVEYLAFDIKNAGTFGYILPYDGKGGSIRVTLSNGVYAIEQFGTPENGKISPSLEGTNNANDFYLGQRIYTDENHNFDEFLYEAFCERSPLLVKVNEMESRDASYLGYDSLRGLYTFNYSHKTAGPNDYPNVNFTVRGDDLDRKIYVMAASGDSTVVEWSAILNDKDMLLPIPVQVGKNFSEASGERNLYNIDDPTYSEAIIPLVVEKRSINRYNIINVYHNWGNVPVKQVSWIQFYAPYYHLSTATTETNCIVPWYTTRTARSLSVLPDFRAMSAPPFSGAQRNSGGTHIFLRYTDADGNFVASENTKNIIGSYGPTYADVTMDYISDDGKIKITYNHMEMPQTDENRTYYEMNYEILEDITFNDFAKDFSFYSVSSNDPKGVYTLLGYLDENNESQVVDAKMAGDDAAYYVLGKNAPYFSYMKMTEDRANGSGYVNLAFLVSSTEFIIGGETVEPNFILTDLGGTLSISLNYKNITLKKGDKITINCILMPWGSQENVYDWSNGLAPDQNVRDVRQNSILDPLKATAKADCEVIDTVYVPMLRTTNGKSAEFTLSGGHNNCAVRIYGFEYLTAPKIYELVNGKWVDYKIASAYYSYNHDITQVYDGYGVNYDGDGTFSYSFVANIKNGAERTFKIVADSNFTYWKEIDKSEIVFGYLDPDSKYDVAENAFVFHTDFINGVKHALNSTSSSIKETDVTEIALSNTKITIGGWAMVEKGVSKYLWSTDGKDWYDCSFLNNNKYANCSQAVIEASNSMNTGYTFTNTDAVGGGISGNNTLVIDLSEYAGQTIKIYLAAIPNESEDKLCVFTVLNNVSVPKASEGNDPEVEPEKEPVENEMNLVVSGEALYNQTQSANGATTGFTKIEYMDGFTRFTNTTGSEASFNVFNKNEAETGKYLVLKYRLPKNNASKVATFRFNVSTTQNGMAVTNNFYSSATLISDDNWHVLVINLEKYEQERETTNEFIPSAEDEKYYAKFLKLFIFSDKNYAQGTYIDIEYVAMCNSFETIKNTNKDMGAIQLSETNNASNTPYVNKVNNYRYLDSTSEYTLLNNYFCFHVDKINGSLTDASGKNYGYNSIAGKGITEKNLNLTVETTLSVGGWCPVQGGVSKFLWSVDGKTWYECEGTLSNCDTNVLSAATGQMSGTYAYTEADGVNGRYAITMDLSAYAGQTVDVRIAAVPEGSEGKVLCILTSLNGVTVSGK